MPHASESASRYRYLDGKGESGVIPTVTKPFCTSCDRVRISAEGQLQTCRFAVDRFDLRAKMRNGSLDIALRAEIEHAVGLKWSGHQIGNINFHRPARSISLIGR